MPIHRRFELDELANRPGTYFNPTTEVLLVIDDSPDVDHEIFDDEDIEETEWILIADESPLDEHRRDELIERFQVSHLNHPTASGVLDEDEDEEDDPLEEDQDELDEEELDEL